MLKKAILSMAALAACTFLYAQQTLLSCVCSFAAERELIWPKGKMPDTQSHQIAAMRDESSAKGFRPGKHRWEYWVWVLPYHQEFFSSHMAGH